MNLVELISGGIAIDLFILDSCNLKCTYCTVDNNDSMIMSLTEVEYIKGMIKQNSLIKKINILGGEPSLHPEIKTIINSLLQLDIDIFVYTNLKVPITITSDRLYYVCTYHPEKDYQDIFVSNFKTLKNTIPQLIFIDEKTVKLDIVHRIKFNLIPANGCWKDIKYKIKYLKYKDLFNYPDLTDFKQKHNGCTVRVFQIRNNQIISDCKDKIYPLSHLKDLVPLETDCNLCDQNYCNLFNTRNRNDSGMGISITL